MKKKINSKRNGGIHKNGKPAKKVSGKIELKNTLTMGEFCPPNVWPPCHMNF